MPKLQNLKNNSFRITFPGQPMAVRNALARMMDQLGSLKLSTEDYGTIELVLAEAMNNIVEHAYIGNPRGMVELQITPSNNGLVCHLRDDGRPMPEGKTPVGSPSLLDCETKDLPEGGFGWFLIRDLAHELLYTRVSGKNLLSFRIAVGSPELKEN